MLSKGLLAVGLLCVSNIFMTCAWYLHLKLQTMKVINQNFTATIVVNSAAMLLGALGRISPLWAAVIHNTATLAVVLNSVRILGVSRRMVKA